MPLTLPPETRELAAVLFGAECRLTAHVLAEMMKRELTISAIVLSGPPDMEAPVRSSPPGQRIRLLISPAQRQTVAEIAASQGIEVYRIGDMRSPQSRQLLQSLSADYLLSVCFPRKIPPDLTDGVGGPSLNVHPSLLPLLRGPDPIFWTFHAGASSGGLTIHGLSPTLDAGPIAAQRDVTIPDGTPERKLEEAIAPITVDMLVELLPDIGRDELAFREQDHQRATYAPFPEQNDFMISADWSARRAFNFARGVAERPEPVLMDRDGLLWRVLSVASYSDQPLNQQEGQTVLEMADGFLALRLAPFQD